MTNYPIVALAKHISPEEQALVRELVEDGLAIQDRFRPEPLYRETGKGHFETRTLEDIQAAREKQKASPSKPE